MARDPSTESLLLFKELMALKRVCHRLNVQCYTHRGLHTQYCMNLVGSVKGE